MGLRCIPVSAFLIERVLAEGWVDAVPVEPILDAKVLNVRFSPERDRVELLVESPTFPTVQGSAFEDFPEHNFIVWRVTATAGTTFTSPAPVEDPDDRHGEVPGA